MQLSRIDSQSFVIAATQLTTPTGPSVGVTFPEVNASTPSLDPADAFTIGDALQKAARKAGFVP